MERFKNLLSGAAGWFRPDSGAVGGKYQLTLVALFALTALAAVTGFIPGWISLIPLALFVVAVLGYARGLTTVTVGASIIVPLLQPLTAVVAAGLAVGVVIYWTKTLNKLSFKLAPLYVIGTLIGYGLLYVFLASTVLPIVHKATVFAWNFLPTTLCFIVASGVTYWVVARRRARAVAAVADGAAAPTGKLSQLFGTGAPATGTVGKILGWTKGSGFVFMWLLVPLSVYANVAEWYVTLAMRHSMHPTTVDKLPDTVDSRFLARPTAEIYIQSHNQFYKTHARDPHIQKRPDGKMWWQAPLHNDTIWGRILGSVRGVLSVDADRTDDHAVDTHGSGFLMGDQSWVVEAAFRARHPFSTMSNKSVVLNDDGSWSILVSVVSKKMTWQLTMVPYLAGVMEVRQNGVIVDHSVAEADRIFPGAVNYPPELFRAYAEAWARWRHGWTGTVAQTEVLEVSEDPNQKVIANPQPYVQDFEGIGLQQVICFEPYGDQAWALMEVMLADANTGELRLWRVPAGYNGPRLARQNVRTSDRWIDWSHTLKIEPLLVVHNGHMYYRICLLSDSESEIQRYPYLGIVLVDARRLTEAYAFRTPAEAQAFIQQLKTKAPNNK